ncbi:MAG: MBL fold metallo-hydrolase [Butyrivibrio sp.]|nr:MBL fold metallo-hydrolase [Butyrivibrio sp.]
MNKVKLVIVSILAFLAVSAIVMSIRLLIVGDKVNDSYDFEMVFLDVGEGDAIYVRCNDESMLIDGGYPEYSQHIYSFLKEREVTDLKYVVCTHPHDDHVGGLSAALNIAHGERFFCSVDPGEGRAYESFIKYVTEQGGTIEHPAVGDIWKLGDAVITVLGPVNHNIQDINNNSIVLKIEYGMTSFVLTGDAEIPEEQDILNGQYDLKCDVLKVGHHGSEYATSKEWLETLAPKYAVISVGAGNTYGHPTEVVLSRLHDVGAEIYRTDLQGDIVCKSNGTMLEFVTGEGVTKGDGLKPEGDIPVTVPGTREHVSQQTYILNTRSHKFHYETCEGVEKMSDKNKEISQLSREELIDMGYEPCQICKP